VKRAVLAPEPDVKVDPVHHYDDVADIVAERVTKTNGRISAKRLLPVVFAANLGAETTMAAHA